MEMSKSIFQTGMTTRVMSRVTPRVTLGMTLGVTLSCGYFPYSSATAQIIPDATLPTPSAATRTNNTTAITGGTRSGDVLFHSFEQFSIPAGQIAQFNNATDLETLVTRVTGPTASNILGQLAAQGEADFFLINPSGIVFGENAQLTVGGSFIGSTADALSFPGGASFSARNPQAPPLLTVSGPIGLQMGLQAGLQDSARPDAVGDIALTGNGHGFILDPDTLEVIPTRPRGGLSVSPGNTLALLGTTVDLDGANLTAVDGRVILGGLSGGGGTEVTLTQDALGWRATQAEAAIETTLEDTGFVGLFAASSVVTQGDFGGDIQIFGNMLEIADGSTLIANTLGDALSNPALSNPAFNNQDSQSRGITVQATEEILLLSALYRDSFDSDVAIFPTSLFAEVGFDAVDRGGDISLQAPVIAIEDGAQVSTSVFGAGNGGDIDLIGERITLLGGTLDFGSSGLYSAVADFEATGQGGNINVTADQLTVAAGATIDGSTFGLGDAGQIDLFVDAVDIVGGAAGLGASSVVSQTEGVGHGGNVSVESDRLTLSGGAELSTNAAFDTGNGGSIDIITRELNLEGTSPSGLASNISSLVDIESEGQGGDIQIRADQFTVSAGAEVRSTTLSDGKGGDLTVESRSVTLNGLDNQSTGLFAAVEEDATGSGGQIRVTTEQLTVENGAQIVVGTLGAGTAGDLSISANDIRLAGQNNLARSGLFASALLNEGTGGTIEIETDTLNVLDGASVNASNFASDADGVAPGQGAAGNVNIRAESVLLRNEATVTTSTLAGDRGNISLESDVIVLRDRSNITANADATATGGNIDIDTTFLITRPEDNSDITANAVQGQGGRVTLSAQQIFGTEFRESLTASSDITASSEFGQSGEVVIDLTGANGTEDIAKLPEAVADDVDPVAAGCPADRGAAFVASGRGGLPDNLSQQLQPTQAFSPAFERELGAGSAGGAERISRTLLPEDSSEDLAMAFTPSEPSSVIEATSWARNADGNITLLSNDHRPSAVVASVNCLRRDA